jgi:hypothetical protein
LEAARNRRASPVGSGSERTGAHAELLGGDPDHHGIDLDGVDDGVGIGRLEGGSDAPAAHAEHERALSRSRAKGPTAKSSQYP